jgi:hypothetical protein
MEVGKYRGQQAKENTLEAVVAVRPSENSRCYSIIG